MSIKVSNDVYTREDFGAWCSRNGLLRVVEVGVDRGIFARDFLRTWKNGYWYLGIDSYLPYPEMPWDRTADYWTACMNLHADSRVKLIRERSPEVVGVFAKINLGMFHDFQADFVYIDGAHDYESVRADITAWWPCLSACGVLAGHDFEDEHEGVKRAVMEFAEAQAREIYLTSDSPRSWYLRKEAR